MQSVNLFESRAQWFTSILLVLLSASFLITSYAHQKRIKYLLKGEKIHGTRWLLFPIYRDKQLQNEWNSRENIWENIWI